MNDLKLHEILGLTIVCGLVASIGFSIILGIVYLLDLIID